MLEHPDNPAPSDPRSQDERAISSGMYKSEVGSDKSLIDRVRTREQQAMTEIFDRYSGLVYSWLYACSMTAATRKM